MPDARYQGAYAEKYIETIALAAGLNALSYKVDDGIDIFIRYTADDDSSPYALRSWPGIDLQVKSWSTPSGSGDHWSFDRLNEKQYNKLSGDFTHPRYLVVIIVPPDRFRLTDLADDGMLLRHRAYYTQVLEPRIEEPSTKRYRRVLVPKQNVLTAGSLRSLIHPDLAVTVDSS